MKKPTEVLSPRCAIRIMFPRAADRQREGMTNAAILEMLLGSGLVELVTDAPARYRPAKGLDWKGVADQEGHGARSILQAARVSSALSLDARVWPYLDPDVTLLHPARGWQSPSGRHA